MGFILNDIEWPQLHLHEQTAQLRCLMTTLCDKKSQPSDWVFTADRVNRMMVEFALNFLPVEEHVVTTPVNDQLYSGVKFAGKIVGVSVIRAGEAMETALRSCCRNIRLGKILVQRDEQTAKPTYFMAKLPTDIARRHVLLMDPMLATGGSALLAVNKLLEVGVKEENIIFVNVVASPEGIHALLSKHPKITLCTASIAEGLNAQKFILRCKMVGVMTSPCSLAFASVFAPRTDLAALPVPLKNRVSSKIKTWRVVDNSDITKERCAIVSRSDDEEIFQTDGHGKVHLIGTGPGDPKMLTIGAVELMRKAEVVLYDRLVSDSILMYINPAAEKICVGKGRGIGTGSQKSIQEQLAHHARKGKRVVRLKGGDPSVFGRVGSEISFLQQQKIDVSVTPGITTASGVAASLGFPLTHGGLADGVCLIAGHLDTTWLARELVERLTLVVYMGLQELPNLLGRLNKGGTHDPVPAVAVQSGTTQSQKVVYGTTHNLAEKVEMGGLRSPTIVIIGRTVSMASEWRDE